MIKNSYLLKDTNGYWFNWNKNVDYLKHVCKTSLISFNKNCYNLLTQHGFFDQKFIFLYIFVFFWNLSFNNEESINYFGKKLYNKFFICYIIWIF